MRREPRETPGYGRCRDVGTVAVNALYSHAQDEIRRLALGRRSCKTDHPP